MNIVMSSFIAGLLGLALALLIQCLQLRRRARELKATKQAFRFHHIRDELQVLAIDEKVRPSTPTYEFVMGTSNIAIRNAGILKLSDVLRLARIVGTRVDDESLEFFQDIRRQPPEVQRLAAETFKAMSDMLVANDTVVYIGRLIARYTWRRVIEAVVRIIDRIAIYVSPQHAEAVRYARKYDRYVGMVQPS